MSDIEQSSATLPFSAKDIAVYLPLAASSLAFAWEVGSFLPIGGAAFGLFSISEHLTFALQALPFAVGFCVSCSVVPILLRQTSARAQQLTFLLRWFAIIFATVIALVGSATLYFIARRSSHLWFPFGTATMIVLGYAGAMAYFADLLRRIQMSTLF